MADAVPVCDVLCEAMEYLSKLGSNLRARSENLKEKKIRKEKLRNFHAVQKAADKVLLICQLSKKSLENVECGVRKVLCLVKEGQSDLGMEAAAQASQSEQSNKYQYFKYRSHKLKVARKVPIKHYMSVKVMARKMPTSMQERYPVYYNCKLYRRRKRREALKVVEDDPESTRSDCNKAAKEEKTDIVVKSPSQNADLSASVCDKNVTEKDDSPKTNDNVNDNNITTENEEAVYRIKENETERSKNDDECMKSGIEGNESVSTFQRRESQSSRKSNDDDTLIKIKSNKRQPSESGHRSRDGSISKRRDEIYSTDSDKEFKRDEELRSKKKSSHSHRHSKDGDEFSKWSESSDVRHSSKKKKKSKNDEYRAKKIGARYKRDSSDERSSYKHDSDNEHLNKSRRHSRNKFRKICVIDDDSENSNDSGKKLINIIQQSNDSVDNGEESSSLQLHKSKKIKLSDSVNEDGDTKKTEMGTEPNSDTEEKDNKIESVKPLIKCVSLTKLLKPDILNKDEKKKSKKSSKLKKSECDDNEENSKKSHKIDKYLKKVSTESDEEFWLQKRKEVSAFIAKNFCINVTRLPELSQSFLQLHSLQKITRSESIICELLVEKEITDNSEKQNEIVPPDNINKVKSALLNDSDSEKSNACDEPPLHVAQIAETVKNALLNDSDIENNEDGKSEKETHCENSTVEDVIRGNTDQIKNDLLNDSDSEKNLTENKNEQSVDVGDQNKLLDDLSTIKDKLLGESDSEKNENVEPDIVRKEDNVEVDDQNKSLDDLSTIKDKLLGESDSEKNENIEPDMARQDDSVEVDDQNELLDDLSTIKDKLLGESDSEKNENGEPDTARKEDNVEVDDQNKSLDDLSTIRDKLLGESDSEKNENAEPDMARKEDNVELDDQNKSLDDLSTIKNKLLGESDSEKNENVETDMVSKDDNTSKENQNNSDNENTGDCQNEEEAVPPNNQEEEIDDLDIPHSQRKKYRRHRKSKRKHIMESMHAKKMLLTYSSSSDTEDEQLKNALKEIKDALLKGVSSSDDEKKEEKKVVDQNSSSDMGEEIITKRKKEKRSEGEASSDDSKSSKHEDDSESKSDISSLTPAKKKMGRSRAQPGGSSQNSDSQDDKDIDGLTNLNSLNKNRRRRGSTSTDKTDTNSISSNKKMPKEPLISQEDMLKAETSSEAGSVVESDAGEELPSISLPGLNGSGIDHLAKDDLLEESDTSASHNEDKKTTDSDGETTMKSKRRKAHATISSDSEAGSSRKKNFDMDVKLSDFEDSDDDGSSEPTKKSKRKKKAVDSDASVGSSSNDGKKKRRRIKQVNDSDASGSDTENEGKNKHGRKNIRKVMGKNQLEEATKKAAREEKERIARIAERQKLYNNLEFDESGKPDEVVLEKVVLDFDPETKKPLIQVDRGLVKKLKPHQANGIKFMWDACFESAKRIKKDKGSGCILAHCMGLGKTLQVVSLTHTLLTHNELTSVNRVLVVCPLSTVLNWVNEFRMWLKHAETDFEVDVYELSRYKQNSERAFQLQQWFDHGGVCVLGYEMFRNLSADNPKKFKKKMLKTFQQSLVDPGPDLVVCDEGHLLKNEKTSLSQSMNRVKTRRRIVLTGTPLQNNLKEYYCMVQFVKPNLLGKYNEYLNRFVNPITNGQYTDSTEHDIRIMKRRSHVLHKMLDGAVQRRDYGVLAPFLPPKHEYVLFITISEVQCKLYQHYLDNYARRPHPGKSSGFLFPDFQSLQRIWTHPLVLKYNSERYEIMQQKKREREEEDSEGSLVDFIDDDSTPDESSTEESSDDLSDLSDDSRKKSKKKKTAKKSKAKDSKVTTRRGTRANPVEMDDEEQNEVVEIKNDNPTEWWIELVTQDELDDMRHSHKLVLLFDILRQCETIGDKLLVFSQSLYSLDLIEHFLGKVDEATQEGRIDEKLCGHVGSWSPGVDYFRLDGSTSCENRSIWCKNFNREDNPRARLFLISTRAGGLGINLVAANRVVIFDVSWNPSHDVQSIFRVYRFGQKKPCYIYRFLAMGTMEEKIYERQVTKQAISKRVIDEQQIDRHYAENDLAELYKFEPTPPVPRPLPPLPKDRLFAEMLREHETQIYRYHEHDSLLENKEEETLSEEERKAAWEDFENEKNRPPPAPFVSAWPMTNGMMSGLLAQQQQQLAYAALAAMLRKDMPNINDNQIRDMLPLIYNANPALMQKMSDIYKYAQPGMMNPMMHPMLGSGGVGGVAGAGGAAAGGGGGGGMGGTSGLQYEPPWQRQQQQQQQQRLQQLLQQNQMGAKYYAGGLGSRDPVAMALQQQRAREMLTGERGRPRGRPPLQPRAPPHPHPAPSGDIVNLDSD